MNDKPIDWSSFTKRIFINASPRRLYDAWTKSIQLRTWFLEEASFRDGDGNLRDGSENCKADDTYSWKWNNWDIVESNKILKANGRDLFEFDFGEAGNVKVEFTESEMGTEIILEQYDIPTTEFGKRNYYAGCGHGWAFWMVNLKAWVEHGILLNQTGIEHGKAGDLANS